MNDRFRFERHRLGSIAIIIALLVSGCTSPSENSGPGDSPCSVRGWIGQIQLPPQEMMKVTDPRKARARMMQFLTDTNIYVKDAPFVSGVISEAGSFLLLDVRPGDVVIMFQPPGLPEASLTIRNLPDNADLILPTLLIDGETVTLGSPELAVARVPIDGSTRKKLDTVVWVGDQQIEVWEVPYDDMMDRREFPTGEEVLPKDMPEE